ncbi:glycosyltransferase [Allokutzneria albata]|uniref:UDP:flavonoid glycosyltransferase YjiC, YdhE family n=1 Tax=Allokutzneria albata TaxID=211114 RepID=A0A1G9Z9R8_ALLAB|nr:glycosyltransferase [Allokutzneria albata]SDN18248.1 UDP:flavonoid glycosyltransferase YjiC, YdhE family [Allokutzneria albata]
MPILVYAPGSRGDVAPFTGLGVRLREAGYEVAIASYDEFGGFVREAGLEFRSIPGDPRGIGATPEGQRWQEGGGGPLGTLRMIKAFRSHLAELNEGILAAGAEGADLLLSNSMAVFTAYHVARELRVPLLATPLQPWVPTADFAPDMLVPFQLGAWGNRAVGRISLLTGEYVMGAKQLGALTTSVMRRELRVINGFSSVVVPPLSDWTEDENGVGFWWPASRPDWEPPAALADFLAAGPPPVYIGFGSREFSDPARLNDLVAHAVKLAGVRAVVQSGWARLELNGDDVLTIGEAPHEWLFPRMAAVIHHCGAGTTAAGLRAGVPAIGVPAITDQPFWAKRLETIGASPGWVPFGELTAERLAALITEAPRHAERARALGELVRAEDGASEVVRRVSRLLG